MYLLIIINVYLYIHSTAGYSYLIIYIREKLTFVKQHIKIGFTKKNIVTYKKIQINSLVNFILVSAGAPHSGQLVGKLSTSSCKFWDRSESSCCSLEALAALAQSAKNEKKYCKNFPFLKLEFMTFCAISRKISKKFFFRNFMSNHTKMSNN